MPRRRDRIDNRCIRMARVSTTMQEEEGFSLDAQDRDLAAYEKKAGLECVHAVRFAESASGKQLRRHFHAVLALIRAPNGPRHLVVEKTDRLTRNLPDFAMLDDLRQRLGLRIHLVREGVVIGPDASPSQMLSWEIQAAVARGFSRNLAAEVKKGHREKRHQGGWTHKAPVGYLNRADGARKWIEPDPERAALVRRLFLDFATGTENVKALARKAREWGLRTDRGRALATASVHRVLRHPLYGGLIPSGALDDPETQLLPGTHEALVDRVTWDRVQEILSGRTRGKGPRARAEDRPHRFAGLLKCEACGRAIVSLRVTKKSGRQYVYYRCASGVDAPCGRKHTNEESLVAMFAERFGQLAFPKATLEIIQSALADASEAERREEARLLTQIRHAKERLEEERARVLRSFTLGDLTAAELALMRRTADAELAKLDAQEAAVRVADREWAGDVVAFLDVLRGVGRLFHLMAAETQRALVALAFEAPRLGAGGLTAPFREALGAVEQAVTKPITRDVRFNPSDRPIRGRTRRNRPDLEPEAGPGTLSEPWAAAVARLRSAPELLRGFLAAA